MKNPASIDYARRKIQQEISTWESMRKSAKGMKYDPNAGALVYRANKAIAEWKDRLKELDALQC